MRVEISELKDYADELTAEVGQEVRGVEFLGNFCQSGTGSFQEMPTSPSVFLVFSFFPFDAFSLSPLDLAYFDRPFADRFSFAHEGQMCTFS